MRFRPPTFAPVRAAEQRAWMRKPVPLCELCAGSAPGRADDLLGPTDERLFRCVGCGRVRRPRPAAHQSQEVFR
jgi:hypothetical protein